MRDPVRPIAPAGHAAPPREGSSSAIPPFKILKRPEILNRIEALRLND